MTGRGPTRAVASRATVLLDGPVRWTVRVAAAHREVDAVATDMASDRLRRVSYGLPFVTDELFVALQDAATAAATIRRDAWSGRDVDDRLAAMTLEREQRAAAARATTRRCRRCRRPAGLHCPGCVACWPDHACSPLCDAAADDPTRFAAVIEAIEQWEGRYAS